MNNSITINENKDRFQPSYQDNKSESTFKLKCTNEVDESSMVDLKKALAENTELSNRVAKVVSDSRQLKKNCEKEIKEIVKEKDSIIEEGREYTGELEEVNDELTSVVTELDNEVQALNQENAELEEKKERLEKEILELERKKAELEKENEKQKQKNKKLKQIFEKCNDYLFGVRTQRNVLLVAVVGIAFGYIFR